MINFTNTSAFFLQHLSYASGDLMVDASFMQTLWTMTPVMSGCELAEGWQFCFCTNLNFVHKPLYIVDTYLIFLLGFLSGGYVLRLFHGHMDECLAIPGADQGDDQRRWWH